MANETYRFPGGVCPSCGHSPLKVEYVTSDNGQWHNLKWKCSECGDSSFLPKDEELNIRSDKRLVIWANKVKQRDGCCVICGNTNDLDAHHLIPVAKRPELRFKMTNGITLCRRCHKLVHDGVKWPEQYR